MKKTTLFNCKEVKFGKTITISNPYGPDGKFDVILRRASTSNKFFEGLGNQIPNQIIWNEEEQQAYFFNPDKQLYKILFEPITMKKTKTTEKQLEETYIKNEIKNLKIQWREFESRNFRAEFYDLCIDLLDILQKEKITIQCGIAAMDYLRYLRNYNPTKNVLEFGGCEITPKLNFKLHKNSVTFDDNLLVEYVKSEPIKDWKPTVTETPKTFWQKVREFFENT